MEPTPRLNRRRLLAIVLSAPPALALLAACGGGNAPAAGAPTSAPAAAATAAPAAAAPTTAPAAAAAATPAPKAATGAVTVRFHGRVGVQADHFDAMAKLFTQDHPDIQVKGEHFSAQEFDQKMQVLVAGGTLGDGMWNASIAGFGPLATKGVLVDHGPLVEAAKFSTQDLWPQAISGATINGKMFGLPWIVHPGRIGLYFNKAMFDKAGQKYPDDTWTYDQLHTTAKALASSSGGKADTFGFVGADQPWGGVVWIRSYGADWLSPDGKKVGITDPKAVQGIQSLADFYGKEKTAPTPSQVQDGVNQMFASSKLAMFQSGYWGISGNYQYAKDVPWGVVGMPKGPAGSKGMFEFDPVSVTKFSKAPQAIFQYVAFLTSKVAGIDIAKRGSVPGARKDVWEDPELTKDPNHVVFAKIMPDVPPLLMPANFRAVEFADAMSKGLDPLLIAKETDAQKVVTDLAPSLQNILDKPVA